MQPEETSGATYAAAKTYRGVRLRKMGQGENLLGKLTLHQGRRSAGAPKRTEAPGSKSRKQTVGLTPLRELTRKRRGGDGRSPRYEFNLPPGAPKP